MNYYLGIDIAKTNHVASLLDDSGNVLIKAIKFTNSNQGFEKLLNSLKDYDNSKIFVSMEATGIYWLSVFSALTDKGFNISVFNPYQIKSYRGVFNNRKQKNDTIDSIIIGDFLRFNGSNNSKLPEENLLSLKDLTRFRCSLVDNVANLKIQVINILDKVFPEYQSIFSDTFGSSSLEVLANCPTPNEIIKFNTVKLSNILNKVSRGRFSKEKVKNIKDIAKTSFGIKITSDACSFEIKQLVNQIIFIEKQITEFDLKIEEIYSKLDTHLRTIPGIGKVNAPIILAEIGDINNFDKPSKLVAFAGIDPSENQSGNKVSSNEKTSKRGSPRLRHALYTAAFVASNNDPILKEFYQKKINEGKHHYVALAGVERKLLHIIYYVLKEQRDYFVSKS